jgi:hypothetical protein
MKKKTIDTDCPVGGGKKIPYDNMKSLMEEIEHLKSYSRDLKQTMEENCIMGSERKNFEKIKNEHIKLIADFNIVKEDMQEMLTSYHNLSKRMTLLEEENRSLRAHNKNLVNFVSKNTGGVGDNEYYEQPRQCDGYYNDMQGGGYDVPNFNTIHNTSSLEMNHIIQNNPDRTSSRGRFLIPKGNY